MKKYLPFILLLAGILIAMAAITVMKKGNSSKSNIANEEETVREVPMNQRPFISLTPSSDGHWLKLKIEQIKVEGAKSLDYELLYSLPDGRTQGVPGTVQLTGEDIVRDLLLGSESSGKFRYDEGVNNGTLTIRFRDVKGKLVGKFSTEFTLTPQKGVFEVSMDTYSRGTKTFTSE